MRKQVREHLEKSSDAELITRFNNGDQNAFVVLISRYQGYITKCINAYNPRGDFNIVSCHSADDIKQIIYIKLIQSLKLIKEPRKFASWLGVIISYTIMDLIRQKKYYVVVSLDETIDPVEKCSRGETLLDMKSDVETIAISRETQREINNYIFQLPYEFAEVTEMRLLDELQYDEIADKLNLALGTVKSKLWRARKRLQEQIAL